MSIIYICILGVGIGLYLRSRSYKADGRIAKLGKEHPLHQMYPICLLLYDTYPKRKSMVNQKSKEALNALHLERDQERTHLLYWCKKTSLVLMVVALFTLLSLFYEITSQNQGELFGGHFLRRPGIGEDQKKVELRVGVKGKEGQYEEELQVPVGEQRESSKAILEKLQKAKERLPKLICGSNVSVDEIEETVELVDSIPGTRIRVTWNLTEQSLVNTDGTLENKELPPEGAVALLYATLSYYEHEIEVPVYLHVMPAKISEQESLRQKIRETIGKAEESTREKTVLELPVEVDGTSLRYQEKERKSSASLFGFAVIVAVLLYFLSDEDLAKKMKEREVEVLVDYPEIVNKFVLLLGAGMTMKHAWETIVKEYLEKKRMGGRTRYAYEEMCITYNEISNSALETKAYEEFGKRMKALPYLRFATLLSQNLKKGSGGLLDLLEYEAMEAFSERKQLAKRQGEEASTKLLLPMGMMLLIVLVIIMVPALMGL